MPFSSSASANVTVTGGGTIVCTSTTRPAAPTPGMAIYETDTGAYLVYTTATTGWRPPWANAWGEVAQAVASTNTATSSATPTDIIGMAVTFPALAGRRYLAVASGHVVGPLGAGEMAAISLTNAAGAGLNPQGRADVYMSQAGLQFPFSVVSSFTAPTGSFTVKARIASLLGGTVEQWNNVGDCLLTVHDAGPTAGPA